MTSAPTTAPPIYEELIRNSIGSADAVLHSDQALQEGMPAVDVYVFRARSVRYSLLVTAGASHQPMPKATDTSFPKRFELYCRLSAKIMDPAAINTVAARLWMAAQFPFRGKQRPLGHWQLCGDFPPFGEESELTAWMLSPPLMDDTPVQSYQFEISEKVGTAALIHATGITEAERAVGEKMAMRDRKLDPFAQELFKRSGSFTHPQRSSVDMTDMLPPTN